MRGPLSTGPRASARGIFDGLSFARSGSFFRHHGPNKDQEPGSDKEPVEREFKLGDVNFVYYTKTPGVHQITNLERDNALRLLGSGSCILNRGVTRRQRDLPNMK